MRLINLIFILSLFSLFACKDDDFSPNPISYRFIETSDQKFIHLAHENGSVPTKYILKTDAEGNREWLINDNNNPSSINWLKATNDGGFLYVPDPSDGEIKKFDQYGEEAWTMTVDQGSILEILFVNEHIVVLTYDYDARKDPYKVNTLDPSSGTLLNSYALNDYENFNGEAIFNVYNNSIYGFKNENTLEGLGSSIIQFDENGIIKRMNIDETYLPRYSLINEHGIYVDILLFGGIVLFDHDGNFVKQNADLSLGSFTQAVDTGNEIIIANILNHPETNIEDVITIIKTSYDLEITGKYEFYISELNDFNNPEIRANLDALNYNKTTNMVSLGIDFITGEKGTVYQFDNFTNELKVLF